MVILGPTDRNFAAGMSGGGRLRLRPDDALTEPQPAEMVDLDEPTPPTPGDDMLVAHVDATDSAVGQRILSDWPKQMGDFVEGDAARLPSVLWRSRRGRTQADVDQAIMAAAWLTTRAF